MTVEWVDLSLDPEVIVRVLLWTTDDLVESQEEKELRAKAKLVAILCGVPMVVHPSIPPRW